MFGSYTEVHVERYETHIAICMARPNGSWRGIEIDFEEDGGRPATVELQQRVCGIYLLSPAIGSRIVVIDCTGPVNRAECTMFDPRNGSPDLFQRPDESIVDLVNRFRKESPLH